MKVLHVAETLGGGIATYLNVLLEDQIRRYGNGKVGLVCPAASADSIDADVRKGILLYECPYARRSPVELFRFAGAYNKALRQVNPAIIHLHSSFAGVLGRLMHYGKTAPVIYTPNGWAFTMTNTPLALRKLYGLVERQLSLRSSAIIAVSDSEYRAAIEAGLGASNLHKIYSGLPDINQQNHAKTASPTGPLRLLFTGRPAPQKGLDWLLGVMTMLPPDVATLDVFGADRPPEDFNGSVPESVRFHGWIASSEVVNRLAGYDALVMPSRWEAFGFSALEAMRASVPVLTSGFGALNELVVNEVTGHVFDMNDPEGFKQFLMSIDRDTLRKWGASSRSRFLEHFTGGLMCDQVHLLLEALAEPGSVELAR